MFLTFLVLGSLVYTLKQAGAVKSNTKNLDQITEVVHSLVRIKSDVRAALSIPSPASGTSSNLELVLIDPNLSFKDRIDSTVGTDPFQVDEQITIQYLLSGELLLRRLIDSEGNVVSQRLVKASKFEVRRSSGLLELTLEVENSRVKKSHTMKVAID